MDVRNDYFGFLLSHSCPLSFHGKGAAVKGLQLINASVSRSTQGQTLALTKVINLAYEWT